MENKESFEEFYNILYNENFNELEALREKAKSKEKKIILAFIGTIIGMNMSLWFCPLLGVILFIVFIENILIKNIKNSKNSTNMTKKHIQDGENVSTSMLQGEKSYKAVFKEKIITPLIQYALPESTYTPFIGIKESEYMRGQWGRYDSYRSDDRIIIDIEYKENIDEKLQLTMAEVYAQTRTYSEIDLENRNAYNGFNGLAGSINLPKDIGCYIKVVKNQLNWFGGPIDRLKIDMTEFEKGFDVLTDDKMKTMQILTSDIMAELMRLSKICKVKFEFYINNDIMHIRFHTGEMFEPEVFGKSMQLDKLKNIMTLYKE